LTGAGFSPMNGLSHILKKAIFMFDDLFDFAKVRTLKQSIGFYLFYATAFLGLSAILTLMGF
jgi:hypothetical protein